MAQAPSQNRRSFLRTSAAGSAAVLSSSLFVSTAGAKPSRSLLEKLNIACIGTANRAAEDVNGVMGENIVAIVDVDSNYLNKSKSMLLEKNHLEPRCYADYREMIEAEGDKIDAVVIGTPDHHHAPASIRAIRAGKHVYCEKPLSHTVYEARLIAKAAAEKGVATQLGTQIHAENNYRRVTEIIKSGAIGDVTEAHVWVGKEWGGGERPTKVDPVPANLNWDLWLGPAPERPYADGRYHPANWRRWWDFGQSTLGDMGCHFMDLPFWALDLRHPTRCEAEGPPVSAETGPLGLIVRYEFPARGSMPACKMIWYDGDLIPRKVNGQAVPANGVMFVGTDGMMFADYGKYKLFPADKFRGYTPPKETIPNSIGHHAEWIKACKDGSPTTCNFDYSGALSETVLLGNVAYRLGKALEWDAENLVATNAPEASKFITKTYRPGWEVA
ncbi:MAG: Gfo/Idh/MocA family oxidoreductase [Planctomycetaceae bacterium]